MNPWSILRAIELPLKQGKTHPTHLLNWDVKPIEPARRTWGWVAFISMWCAGSFSMSSFQLGSSMLSLGLNWWQVIIGTLFGYIFTMMLIMAASWPGLEYAIPFPVATRAAWGHFGTIFVVINRIFLSIIWTGVQSWQGGLMTYVCLRAIWPSIDNIPNTIPSSTGMTLPQFIGFIVFFVIQLPMLLLSPQKLKYLVLVAGITGFVVELSLTIWATSTMGKAGFGSVLKSGERQSSSALGWAFIFCFSLTVSSTISGALSVSDYTRFGKSVRSGAQGQFLSFIPGWLSSVFGLLTVAATQKRFGAALWSVVQLLVAIQDHYQTPRARASVFFCGLAFGIGQLGMNVTTNTFSAGTDMSAMLSKYISIRRGQFIAVFIGLAINPWYLVSAATVFLSAISGYGVFLQPCLGIMIAYYFIIFKQKLKVEDLYTLNKSIYYYNRGVNWRAVVSWILGVAPHLPGFLSNVNHDINISEGGRHLYYLVSFTGFFISFAAAIFLNKAFPVAVQQEFLQSVNRWEAIDRKEEYIVSLEATEDLAAPESPLKKSPVAVVEMKANSY